MWYLAVHAAGSLHRDGPILAYCGWSVALILGDGARVRRKSPLGLKSFTFFLLSAEEFSADPNDAKCAECICKLRVCVDEFLVTHVDVYLSSTPIWQMKQLIAHNHADILDILVDVENLQWRHST